MKTSICCAAKATFLSAMKTPVLVRRRTQHESEEEPSEPYTVSEVEELELPEEPWPQSLTLQGSGIGATRGNEDDQK
ncbi:unnamed protein product [Gadus morhua 'NCC']